MWGAAGRRRSPDRVRGLVVLAPQVPLAPTHADRTVYPFTERLDTTEGWAKYNRYYWLEGGYPDFLEFFLDRCFTEPHSTKQIEDFIGGVSRSNRRTLVRHRRGPRSRAGWRASRSVCERVRAPVLVIHGDKDEIA